MVPKRALPETLCCIGGTGQHCGLVIENPGALSLRGYPRVHVTFNASIMGAGGVHSDVVLSRYLVELGLANLSLTGLKVRKQSSLKTCFG